MKMIIDNSSLLPGMLPLGLGGKGGRPDLDRYGERRAYHAILYRLEARWG